MIIQFQFEFEVSEEEDRISIQIPKKFKSNPYIYTAIKELLAQDLDELYFRFNKRLEKLRNEKKL